RARRADAYTRRHMNPLISMTLLFVAAAPIAAARTPKQSSAGSRVVTSAQINGTWRMRHNEFKLWALGHQKIKVEFSGVYEYKLPSGPMANTGEGSGIAHIEGDTITFKPDVSEDECLITMKYTGGKLHVSQIGICGFGHNVTADGDYKRVSSTKPKFDEQ
ncbi:MAG: hypothetical protein ACREDR_19675, partial [Blastocatellia bacterium]